jgi:hypothetical protein
MTPYVQHNAQFALGLATGVGGCVTYLTTEPVAGILALVVVVVSGFYADRIRTRYAPWRPGRAQQSGAPSA